MRWSARDVLRLSVSLSFFIMLSLPPLAALENGMTGSDVGDVGTAGSYLQSNEQWTVRGAGADIWGSADGFFFIHKQTRHLGSIVARVEDLQDTDPFAKAGVMVRASL